MKLIVNQTYQLKKFIGKGGWTFVEIPEIKMNKNNPFGWQQVSGFIDSYELKQYKLMPMGNGNLFLPVKAAIRKLLNKHEGDFVHVKLFMEESDIVLPQDFQLCLKDEPRAFDFFQTLDEMKKTEWVNYIYSAKSEAKKIERMAAAINFLAQGLAQPI